MSENVAVNPPGDELLVRLEELARRYEANHLPDHARGVWHALREAKVYFAAAEQADMKRRYR